MAVNNPSGGGIGSFVSEHPALSFGIAFVGALVLWTVFTKKQSTGVSTAQDLSGVGTDASGQRVVYVPTQTTFSTSNIGADYSNDPNLTTISNSPVVSNSPISVTNNVAPPPVIISKPTPPPPVQAPPPPRPPGSTGGTDTGGPHPIKAPPPPATTKKWQIFWNYPYVVGPGDTLSKIAANITDAAHRAGMPNNMAITWQMIYNYNKSIIDSTAAAHGNPIPGGPANNIFPGEKIWLAGWTYA